MTILLPMLYAFTLAAQTTDVPITGFANIPFGTEKQTAIKLIKQRTESFSTEIEGSDTYIIHAVNLGGELFNNGTLFFYQDKLFCGIFDSDFKNRDSASNLFSRLLKSLSDKYGQPQGLVGRAAWRNEDWKAIMLSLVIEDSKNIVRLTYIDRVVQERKAAADNNDL